MDVAQDLVKRTRGEGALWVARLAQVWHAIHAAVEKEKPVPNDEIAALVETLRALRGLLNGKNWKSVDESLAFVETSFYAAVQSPEVLSSDGLQRLAEIQLILEKLLVSDQRHDEEDLKSELVDLASHFPSGVIGGKSLAQNPEEGLNLVHLTALERQTLEATVQEDASLYFIACVDPDNIIENRLQAISSCFFRRRFEGRSCYVVSTDLEAELVERIADAPVVSLKKSPDLEEQVLVCLRKVASSEVEDHSVAEGIDFGPENSGEWDATAPDRTQGFQSREAIGQTSSFSEKTGTRAAGGNQEIIDDFLNNAEEMMNALTQSLLQFEKNFFDPEIVNEMFRYAHTLKGTSAMLGYSCIEKLCHAMENLLDKIRKKQIQPHSGLVDALFVGTDRLRELFAMLRAGALPEIPVDDLLFVFEAGNSTSERPLAAASEVQEDLTALVHSADSASQVESEKRISNTVASAGSSIRVDLKRVDTLVNLVGELVMDRTRFLKIEESLRASVGTSDVCHQMSESVSLLNRHMNEVQSLVMRMRMIPVSATFSKFTRVVRDIARQCGKDVDFFVEGGETELDKSLVEELYEPLVHLIRNSVDHGIESPLIRESAGKSQKGWIRLSASQQGNIIIVCVEDDGKGLDAERIRSKAVEKGLIKESDSLSTQELINLIFEPGFSTAESVSTLSGRGVGLDVVRKNIQKLKGVIELSTEQGKGTKFSIKMPTTLAILPSLMVESAGVRFAIPLVNVIESLRLSQDKFRTVGRREFAKLREELVPLVELSRALGINRKSERGGSRMSNVTNTLSPSSASRMFVVVGSGHQRVGIVVDRLLGQQDIVIKSLGHRLSQVFATAGGCVMDDGYVALVLDVGDVISDFCGTRSGYETRAS